MSNKRRTHITIHAFLMTIEPTPMLIKVSNIETVLPIDRTRETDTPEAYTSRLHMKGGDIGWRIVESVADVQTMIDGVSA